MCYAVILIHAPCIFYFFFFYYEQLMHNLWIICESILHLLVIVQNENKKYVIVYSGGENSVSSYTGEKWELPRINNDCCSISLLLSEVNWAQKSV